MGYRVDFSFVFDYWEALLYGLATTLKLTILCLLLGMLLGFVLSLLRTSSSKIAYVASTVYVEIFRGVPVLIQLFWVFFCLPLVLHIEIGNFTSAVIALTLFTGAITSETFRASMRAIPRDQHDASVALGLRPMAKILYVIFPQTFIRAVPPLLSNTVSLFKESALVSAVGMSDLLYVGQNISNRTARPLEILTTCALIYFVIAFPLTRLVTVVERKVLRKIDA